MGIISHVLLKRAIKNVAAGMLTIVERTKNALFKIARIVGHIWHNRRDIFGLTFRRSSLFERKNYKDCKGLLQEIQFVPSSTNR